ncbi:uncharacterized protein LAJ45_01074 [Morchella importuna]|uniref:uncharacterized protein n=1 Tax=Morchella importuna TaxID=1174673 RepID=UPI001E8DBB8D|nr:uncharacterized protein LAJ45_01074 [Morchella importuna]KAH8154546.1 hypothetical protein LAJ45_01074 [Morchella importuna]
MDEPIRPKVESPPAPAGNSAAEEDNGIFYAPIPRDRVVPTSTWDTDDYTPSLVYPQGPIFGPYDPKTSPNYREEPSLSDIRCRTMIDENKFADTEGKFNGGIKKALIWDGTCHHVCPTLEVDVSTKAKFKTEFDDDSRVRMSDIPPYPEGQSDGRCWARFVENQDRRAPMSFPEPEQGERALQTKIEGVHAMALDEEAHALNLSYAPNHFPRPGVEVGNPPGASTRESPNHETSSPDLSRIPHHVEYQGVHTTGASEAQEITDENTDLMERIDIDSEQPVHEAPATTTLPECAPLGITTEDVVRMFNETQASGLGLGSFVGHLGDLRDQQISSAGKAQDSATTKTQEGAPDATKPVQYHYPQPKTAGRRIAQPKPTPKSTPASAGAARTGILTNRRLRRSATSVLDLFEKETQTGKYAPEGGVQMDADYDSVEEQSAKKHKPNKRQRKRAKEAEETASEAERVSDAAQAEADMQPLCMYAYAGIAPGESSSELSTPSKSTESLVDLKDAPTNTKPTYNHPSQRLVIHEADLVPDLALCRAGERITDARARLGLPPRAKKEKTLPLRAE